MCVRAHRVCMVFMHRSMHLVSPAACSVCTCARFVQHVRRQIDRVGVFGRAALWSCLGVAVLLLRWRRGAPSIFQMLTPLTAWCD